MVAVMPPAPAPVVIVIGAHGSSNHDGHQPDARGQQ
jgi:hypothetical protein